MPGTDWVASGGLNDEQTVIFDLGPPLLAELGTFPSAFPDVRLMRAVGDGNRLAVTDGLSTGVIDAETGDLIDGREAGLDRPHLYISRAETSPDGLYTTGLDRLGKSKIWSNIDGSELFAANDGWQIRGFSDDATLAVLVELVATQEPDNRAEAGSTRLVRTLDGMVIAELEIVEWEAAFSSDDRYVATVAGENIQIWDTSTGAKLGSIKEYDLLGGSILWTPDGSRLIVGGFDGIIRVFDVGRLLSGVSDLEAMVTRIPAHDTSPMVLADLKDGSLLLTQSREEPAKVWDLETGALLGEFGTPVDGDFVAAAFHPTERRLYAEVGADLIGIFTLDPEELIEIARSRLSRELIEEECQLYLRRSCEGG
ncbi:MAG: WD40 repeat domain-containing protein [Acidimicrobiia bacterium]